MKIYIPKDAAALSLGADETAEALAAAAPEAEIVRNGSYGLFWLEPMVEIEKDGRRIAFGSVMPEDVPSLIESGFGAAHPLYLGKTADIPALKMQNRLTFARCGVIDPLSLEDYTAYGGFDGLKKALEMPPQKIVDEVKESGLRGRGGAAFPTGIKWQTVLDCAADQKYIVCNADEGDSGTFADRMIMEGDPFTVIEGMIIAGLAVGATMGYIYLRSEYPHARDTLRAAIKTAYESGYLGDNIQGSGKAFDLELRMGAGSYICGEETALLESLEGKRGMIRYKPPLPAIKGLFGKPTVVNNVISLATIPVILEKGAEHHAAFGEGKSRGTLTVQLAGNVKYPGLYELAFGLPLRDLIYEIGGGTATGRPFRAVQCGGPLGPFLSERQLDLAVTYEDFAEQSAMVGHGGVVVFDDTVDMAQMARFSMEFGAEESCGKCTPCRIGTVRGYETIDKIIRGENRAANKALLEELCDTLIHGSLCAHGGLIPYPVLSALREFPEDFGLDRQAA
ncbi:MAG: formate dehydrogenase [Micavibrio sp.]|nr:MAG: formate dehydrogenase [Micavibrio sp.]